MRIYLRDITDDKDITRQIPCDNLNLNPNHEYIIIDGDIDCGEYFSIESLNNFLKETEVDIDTLKILNSTYLWNEVVDMVQNETYVIYDFDAETSTWYGGSGATDTDHNIGQMMYDLGYNTLPCEVPKELEDYIEWEHNWSGLESVGWRKTRYNGTTYIVHR